MPNGLAGTSEVAAFIAEEVSVQTYINIMDQYHPCGEAFKNPDINRRVSAEEFRASQEAAREAGLNRLDDRRRHWVSI